jgi:hypothetical protein
MLDLLRDEMQHECYLEHLAVIDVDRPDKSCAIPPMPQRPPPMPVELSTPPEPPPARCALPASAWAKYQDPATSRLYWWKKDEWFFEDAQHEWKRFDAGGGQFWWWKDDDNYFFEETGSRLGRSTLPAVPKVAS